MGLRKEPWWAQWRAWLRRVPWLAQRLQAWLMLQAQRLQAWLMLLVQRLQAWLRLLAQRLQALQALLRLPWVRQQGQQVSQVLPFSC